MIRAARIALLVVGLVAAASCDRGEEPDDIAATPEATPAATPCVLDGGAEETVESDRRVSDTPLLNDVRFNTKGCPRVVFAFENEVPPYTIGYDDPPFAECGSGEEISTTGWGASAFLAFHSDTASGVDLSGPTFRITYEGDKDIDVGSSILRRIRETCDHEATLEWVIALDERRPFKVFALADPPRIVVDIDGS